MSGPERRRIYLMRHGAVSYFDAQGQPLDPRNVPLNASGCEQAEAAAQMLAGVPFDRAICSGMPRAEETARRVLGERSLLLQHDERFKEIRAGRLREIAPEQREQAIAFAYDTADEAHSRFIGGEQWQAFAQRVLEGWVQLLRSSDWSNLLLVAHDAVNRVILSHIAGSGLTGLKAFEQDPAAINILEADPCLESGSDGSPRCLIRCINLAAYDPIRQHQRLTVMEQVWRSYRPRSAAADQE